MTLFWQTINFSKSSTFNKMHPKRDSFIKHIFPELWVWCENGNLPLADIDLCWSITEEGAIRRKNIIKVCLNRIDECRPFSQKNKTVRNS